MYAIEPSEVDPPTARETDPLWGDVHQAILMMYTVLAAMEVTLEVVWAQTL